MEHRIFPPYNETDGSLPCSQQPAARPNSDALCNIS